MKPLRGTLLLTGFEPFGGSDTNPTADIVRVLDGQSVAGLRIAGAVLPCVFGTAARELARLRRSHRPRIVVCLGLAESRTEITPERVAINVDDARIPDNAGARPVDVPIVRGGPVARWSTLPIKAIVEALRAAGLPSSVSQTAGTFVCNHVFYRLLHSLARRGGRGGDRCLGGFIHVPPVRVLPLEKQIAGIELALDACVAALRVNRGR